MDDLVEALKAKDRKYSSDYYYRHQEEVGSDPRKVLMTCKGSFIPNPD